MTHFRRFFLVIAILLLGCNFVTGLPQRLAGGYDGPGTQDPDAPDFQLPGDDKPANPDADYEGPERIDLDDPDLHLPWGPNSLVRFTLTYYGQAADGEDLFIMDEIQETVTGVPAPGYAYLHRTTVNGEETDRSETAWVDGTLYSIADLDDCSVTKQGFMPEPSESMESILEDLQGKAPLGESGYDLYGVLTDRYDLSISNLDGAEWIDEFHGGSLYRAQEGGYVAQFEIYVQVKQDPSDPFLGEFAPNSVVTLSFIAEQSYANDEQIMAYPPYACEWASEEYEPDPNEYELNTDPSMVRADIPMLAADQIDDYYANEGMVTYVTPLPYQEVVDYYSGEMEARGWEFVSLFDSDLHTSLTYQKDGETAQVEIDADAADGPTSIVLFWVQQ
jgi:hypothetical protein